MNYVAGLLMVLLFVNCGVLILLVLIQLPKKDAGAGLAFGGGAADALFGAGSGNVLTKITKWAVVVFFVLALFLGYLEDKLHSAGSTKDWEKQVQQKQMAMPPISPQSPAAPAAPAVTPSAVPAPAPAPAPAANPAVPPSASTNLPEAPAQSK